MSFPIPGGPSPRDRFVGFGLALVVLGWLALVADLALAALQLQPGSLVAMLSLKNDIATLSETLIVTGLGLAILGGLREGFGALSRFFDAVLQRSGSGRPAQGTAMPEAPPVALDDEVAPPRRAAAERAPGPAGSERTPERTPERMPERSSPPAPGRNYRILPDGSVEVETLLGTRVFASMDEARDFIR